MGGKVDELIERRRGLVNDLEKIQAELTRTRGAMGAAILGGKTPEQAGAEVARLREQEADLKTAIEGMDQAITAAKAEETAKQAARKVAEANRKEAEKLNKQAVKDLANLVSLFEKISALRSGNLIAAMVRQSCAYEAERLRITYPELFGLPPRPTPEQSRIKEAEYSVDCAQAFLDHLKQARKENPSIVRNHQMEEAERNLQSAKQRLADLRR